LTFLLQVSFIFPVFPLTHALMVMASRSIVANAMWIPDEDRLHTLLLQEADDLSRSLVSPVADLPFGAGP